MDIQSEGIFEQRMDIVSKCGFLSEFRLTI